MLNLRLSRRSRALPTGHRREHHPTGSSAPVLPRHGPRKEEPPITDDRSNVLASCLLEGLRVRKGGVIGTLSALEANDSQEYFTVCRSEPSEVFRSEGPRHTLLQQSLDYLGL